MSYLSHLSVHLCRHLESGRLSRSQDLIGQRRLKKLGCGREDQGSAFYQVKGLPSYETPPSRETTHWVFYLNIFKTIYVLPFVLVCVR